MIMKKRNKVLLGILAVCVCFIAIFVYFDNHIVTLSKEDEEKLRTLIVENDKNIYHPVDFTAVSQRIFMINETESGIDIYGKFFIKNYVKSEDGKTLNDEGGYNDLLVITLDKEHHEITNVWSPESGSEYVGSILAKFPFMTWSRAFMRRDSYSDDMLKECEEQMREYQLKMNSHE